jgi:hypothetical protein
MAWLCWWQALFHSYIDALHMPANLVKAAMGVGAQVSLLAPWLPYTAMWPALCLYSSMARDHSGKHVATERIWKDMGRARIIWDVGPGE